MKTANTIVKTFQQAFSFSSLLDAHRICRCSKGHKKEIVDFELNLFANLNKLSKTILSGKYSIKFYRQFKIFEPKERVIDALSYKHRLVQYSLCKNILEPILNKRLIENNCACRCGKGTDFARNKFEQYAKKMAKQYDGKIYFLKCDVSKYFASINHKILKQKLEKLNFEPDVFNLLLMIIDSYNFDSGIGIPIGNQSSQWFALFYMDDLDRYIKEELKIRYYIRYMDDLIIIHNNLNFLKNCKKNIIQFAENLKLKMNKKTQIIKGEKGVGFLGFKYCVYNQNIKKQAKQYSKKRLNKNLKRLNFFAGSTFVNKEYVTMRLVTYKNYYHSDFKKLLVRYKNLKKVKA